MKIKTIELFAGVGGFRVGLNKVTLGKDGKAIENGNFDFVWTNQWEPSTKIQHAFDCYQTRFGESPNHCNVDITQVNKKDLPNHDLLVGGFPCQDYSVARSLSNEQGISGKKGVLWWEINNILKVKKTPFVLLENVDRLLISPSKQRGRDFGIMLKCFNDLGYAVEWRVINAAEYSMPQKRRRIFIFAYHKSTNYYKEMKKNKHENILQNSGLFASTFPIDNVSSINSIDITSYADLVVTSDTFAARFENTGYMINGLIYTTKTKAKENDMVTLNDIVIPGIKDDKYIIGSSLEKFKYLKGSKKIPRQKNGITYNYSEGAMAFPDKLDSPGRTMLTSESSINRSTHVIEDPKTKKLRLITPVEAERLNQFPDDWTNTGMPEKRRYFMMGNALVCGIVERLGNKVEKIYKKEKS